MSTVWWNLLVAVVAVAVWAVLALVIDIVLYELKVRRMHKAGNFQWLADERFRIKAELAALDAEIRASKAKR